MVMITIILIFPVAVDAILAMMLVLGSSLVMLLQSVRKKVKAF